MFSRNLISSRITGFWHCKRRQAGPARLQAVACPIREGRNPCDAPEVRSFFHFRGKVVDTRVLSLLSTLEILVITASCLLFRSASCLVSNFHFWRGADGEVRPNELRGKGNRLGPALSEPEGRRSKGEESIQTEVTPLDQNMPPQN